MASHRRRIGGEGATANEVATIFTDAFQAMIENAARQQVQEALRLQEQEVERRLQEALRQMEQQLQERDEAIRALLDERMQRVEERMTAVEERVRSAPAREGGEQAAVGQGTLEQLEGRMGKLEEAVQRALAKVFPRVEALVAQLEKPSSPRSSRSPPPTSAPACTAEERERQRVAQRLQEVGANRGRARLAPSCRGEDLCWAAHEGRLEDVRRLVESGADVNYTNSEGYSPLIAAFYLNDWGECDAAVVSLLLERGAGVNAVDLEGWSALHCAAHGDSSGRCVALLVDTGADVDARDECGITPLHRAAFADNVSAVCALLASGAKKSLRGWSGQWRNKTPLDIAISDAVRDLLC